MHLASCILHLASCILHLASCLNCAACVRSQPTPFACGQRRNLFVVSRNQRSSTTRDVPSILADSTQQQINTSPVASSTTGYTRSLTSPCNNRALHVPHEPPRQLNFGFSPRAFASSNRLPLLGCQVASFADFEIRWAQLDKKVATMARFPAPYRNG